MRQLINGSNGSGVDCCLAM